MLAILLLASAQSHAEDLIPVQEFGTNPGNLRMWLYASGPGTLPLVVALHGCKQSAHNYANDSGWTKYARQFKFNLLLPEQKRGWLGNNPLGCFNWYYRGDQAPGRGEVLSVKQAIDSLIKHRIADPKQIYITGLSAGGAMAVAILASYPDTFAGGGIVAGVPYGCAQVPDFVPQWWLTYRWRTSYANPFQCMDPGLDLTPEQWGTRVRAAGGNRRRDWPTISIWHGSRDAIVAIRNGWELVEQWTNAHQISSRATQVVKGDRYTRYIYTNRQNEPVVEFYLLDDIGHGQPVKPANAWLGDERIDQCGSRTKYMQPGGICASYRIGQFWGLVP